jgi:CBS-domain-containing membrane protein
MATSTIRAEAEAVDPVQETSEESFPATDPPPWIGGRNSPPTPVARGACLTFAATSAGGCMSMSAISIRDDATLAEATLLLTTKGLHAVPVIDLSGRPVGVISQSDLLVHAREDIPAINRLTPSKSQGAPVLVRDLMTPGVIVVAEDAPLRKVVEELLGNNVHQVFVVDHSEVLIGSVSAVDVLKQLRFE